MKRKNEDKPAYCPVDNHRCKSRAHSEDQFSAPRTIYFTLLSSLAAFPEICQQLLSAKDTHLASKSNDNGSSSLPMEVTFDSKNKSIYSQRKKKSKLDQCNRQILENSHWLLVYHVQFLSKRKKKSHSSISSSITSIGVARGRGRWVKKCHYRKCWLMERNKAT